MSNAIIAALTGGMHTLNTELAKAFAPDGVRCFLLRRDVNSGSFTGTEVTSGFFSEWSNYRDATVFSFATTDADFINDFSLATHIGYGVPDADNEIEVYAFVNDQTDRVTPDGSSPFYKAFARKEAAERFTAV